MAYGRKKITETEKKNSVEETFAIYRGAISMRLKRKDLRSQPSMPVLPPFKEDDDDVRA